MKKDVRYFDWRDNMDWPEMKAYSVYSSRRQIDIFNVSYDIEDDEPLKPFLRVSIPEEFDNDFRKIYKSILRHYYKTKQFVTKQVWAWKQTEDGEWIDLSGDWDFDSHEKYTEAIGYLF